MRVDDGNRQYLAEVGVIGEAEQLPSRFGPGADIGE